MKNNELMFRQGDVLLKKIKKLPKGVKLKNTDIVLEGEATGHAHRLQGGLIYERYNWPDNDIFVNTTMENCLLVHEEHDTIELEPNYYIMVRQREYKPSVSTKNGNSRWVFD